MVDGSAFSESGPWDWASRLGKIPNNLGLLNRAVLWHLQFCLRLLDRLGYHAAAANVAAAIDAITMEAMSVNEISEMDLDHEERVRLILEMFAKHGKISVAEDDSKDAE